jgi:DNA-binding MarR family transcriptional regulator
VTKPITSLGYLTGKAHGLIKARVQRHLDAADIGLKMELYPILNTLWRQDGVTQQCLSDQLGYDRHKMSRLLDILEESGWIVRKDHPNSRREKMILLTEQSHSQKKAILECIDNAHQHALEGFSPESKQTLIDGLNQIIQNLS